MATSLLPSYCSILPRSLTKFLYLVLSSYIPSSPEPSPPQTPVYDQVADELHDYLDSHGQSWWRTSGHLLAALLQDAGYSSSSKHHILTFFGRTIVPYMGVTYNPQSPQWRSFMTDDHHPIELSWDWHTGHKPPTVRFSIEPVGIHAGTPSDKDNAQADTSFRKALLSALPDTNMEWFHYLDHELAPASSPAGLMEGHPSKIFYAFDLAAESVTAKAYFFPGFKARETNRTNLQVISDVIAKAPHRSNGQFDALRVFENFAEDVDTPPLEMDMVAIDMDPPQASRLKIYFRNRATSFASVRQMMTLGGRVKRSELEAGIEKLRRLWDAMLGQEGVPDAEPLSAAGKGKATNDDHRTAGLLYNVEFRSGSPEPKVKIYIPVRHYAPSDGHVITAVHEYMRSVEENNEKGLGFGYATTMRRLFRPDAVQQRGLHTYIACSIQGNEELRVVSYINCQGEKMVQ
ncbi:aromatic prenyltransferase [Aspergillus pseudoustus]|uniref:Aromatic prenyltransferase n=1 Tax=Aspergillus pseudoustus TaxID=1810923 RepID=A0ABR4K779_9EURO